MKYFKNTELAKLYNVSEKSVRNWIQSAQEGKLDLELYAEKGKECVANTTHNTRLIELLAERGKKFKNTRGYKVLKPTPKFYDLYSPNQVLDIMANIDIHREIPLQYTYFNSGAERWDSYTHNLLKQDSPNSLRNTIQLLDLNLDYIETLIEGYKEVNFIDLGVGNALPMRKILAHFHKTGRLKRYIAIDISKELLSIAERNVKNWFNGEIKFETYVRDIAIDRFNDLIAPESFGKNADTINLAFFLGGTVSNFREPDRVLSTIHDSLGKHDLLIFSKKLDTEKSRRYFEMTVSGNQEVDLVLKLLGMDESLYSLEQFFDENKMARQLLARLNVAISINFELYGQEKVIELNKGDGILLWRARHQSTIETLDQFDDSNFELLQASRSPDQDYLLTISRIKINPKQGAI